MSSMFTDIRSPEGATTVQIHSMCGGGILGYEGEVIWVILYPSFKLICPPQFTDFSSKAILTT